MKDLTKLFLFIIINFKLIILLLVAANEANPYLWINQILNHLPEYASCIFTRFNL